MRSDSRAEALAGVDAIDLSDRTAVVTGATGDIGREIALSLARLGADLHVHGRDRDAGSWLVDAIEAEDVDATFHRADFLEVDAINELGRTLAEADPAVDLLVHNAGASFDEGVLTDFGMERTFQVNHLAPFLLTEHLRPLPADARVVVVASEAHRRGSLEGSFSRATDVSAYDAFGQYSSSKLANVLYAAALARRVTHATVNSCHPGFVPASGLWRNSSTGVRLFMRVASRLPQLLVGRVVDTPVQAAATPVYLAASDAVTTNGAYYRDCEPATPSEPGRDGELAEALWSWSQAQLGIPA